jgi:hypothetical protein
VQDYGWKKRAGGSTAGVTRPWVKGPTADVIRKEVRAVLPGILREEIARSLGALFGKRAR